MKKNSDKYLSVVFSFRNEEEVIDELIMRVVKTLDRININYELIFVDDDSDDKSLKILKGYLEKGYPIKVIKMSRRFGVGACLLAGLSFATGEVVVYMDSDLQDPPELIPMMIEKYKQGFDIVHMQRDKREGETFLKMLLTKIAYRIIKLVSGDAFMVNVGDFKLLSKRVVKCFNELNEYDPYLRGLSYWFGFRQTVLKYNRDGRAAGKSHFSLLSSGPINEFIRAVFSNSNLILYFFLAVGILSLMMSFFLFIFSLVTKFLGISIEGTSSIIIVTTFFGGFNLFSIGVMGIYLSRIYDQIKGRPRYIIENVFQN
jgi:glycosyltransferase involved in cell wall biosynthesis